MGSRAARDVHSVEGVAHWRLLEAKVLHELAETERALRWLAERGYLIEESIPGVSPLYRLDPTHPGEPELVELPDSDSGSRGHH